MQWHFTAEDMAGQLTCVGLMNLKETGVGGLDFHCCRFDGEFKEPVVLPQLSETDGGERIFC